MESENQYQAHCCMATTLFREPSFRAAMPSDYTSTQFGKLVHLMNGSITRTISARRFPLPHWCLFLHGTRVGTWLSTRNEALDLCRILSACCSGNRCISYLSLWAGSFSDGMPLGISGTFNYMLVFQAEHNILIHPFHMFGVAGVFGGSLLVRCGS